jgi:hypothetical protein
MTKNLLSIACCMVVASLAAGCGSSHSNNNAGPAQQQEDAAASNSVAGLVGFAQGQIARTDDVSEPRPIAGISPPVSDVDEPAVI